MFQPKFYRAKEVTSKQNLPCIIGHFRVPPDLCFKTRVGRSTFYMEIIFHSHANKTHFHKKGCAPSLILKEETRDE